MKRHKKILIGFYFFTITISIILSTLFFRDGKTQLIKRNTGDLFLSTYVTEEELKYIFNDLIIEIEILKKIINKIPKNKIVEKNLIDFFRIMLKSRRFLENIYFVNHKGEVTIVYPYTIKKIIYPASIIKEIFVNARINKTNIMSDIIVDNQSDSYHSSHYTILSSPIFSNNNIFKGIIGAEINLKEIGLLIQTSDSLKTKYDFLDAVSYCLTSDKALVLAGPNNASYGSTPSFIPKGEIKGFLNKLKKNNFIINDLIKFGNSKYYISTTPYKLIDKEIIVMGVKPFIHSTKNIRSLYLKIFITLSTSIILMILITLFILQNEKKFALLSNKYKKLEIIIDEQKKTIDVEDVLSSGYFRQIKEKIKEINNIYK